LGVSLSFSHMVEEKVKSILKMLIRTKSYSGEEREIAYLIRGLLSESGVDKVFIDRYGNVIGVIEGGERSIVFEGHMDHVPEGNLSLWKHDPYAAVEENGKIYGRGAVDMKGAIASMIVSAGFVRESRDKPTIYYVFVPYEEIVEGLAFRYALEETLKIKPSLVVLGEATNLNIHIGQRGRAVIYIDVYGESSHASMPDKGINPVVFTGYLIQMIFELNREMPVHSILGKSTITPTVVECSPKSPPMIPDFCRLVVDRRFIVGETRGEILSALEKAVSKAGSIYRVRDVRVYIPREEVELWTGVRVEAEHYFPAWILHEEFTVRRLLSILSRVNPSVSVGVWRFSTDGVYSAGTAHYTTIGFGPGLEELAHKPNEYVEVKHLVKAVEAYVSIAENFGEIIA